MVTCSQLWNQLQSLVRLWFIVFHCIHSVGLHAALSGPCSIPHIEEVVEWIRVSDVWEPMLHTMWWWKFSPSSWCGTEATPAGGEGAVAQMSSGITFLMVPHQLEAELLCSDLYVAWWSHDQRVRFDRLRQLRGGAYKAVLMHLSVCCMHAVALSKV